MTQHDIKAIFFDVDGTLISHRKHAVPVSTIHAIARLRKQGILTFVATGRHPIELKKLLPESLEFDAYLCLNGMYCFNHHEVISTKPIPQDDIKGLLKILDEKPFPCTFITQNEMYMNYANDLVAEVQRDISSDVSSTKDISNVLQEEILQVIPYGLDDVEISTVLDYMPHCK
ncbi:MAG: HAD-IIB family hydrolase, partial [Solobacterium sp.]|nr:HAD-IIB family hydrolase [Solobacterium sp.]